MLAGGRAFAVLTPACYEVLLAHGRAAAHARSCAACDRRSRGAGEVGGEGLKSRQRQKGGETGESYSRPRQHGAAAFRADQNVSRIILRVSVAARQTVVRKVHIRCAQLQVQGGAFRNSI